MRYIYTGKEKRVNGVLVKQICYINGEDCQHLGGWIAGDYCLSSNSTIGKNVIVTGHVGGQATILGNSVIEGTVLDEAYVFNSRIMGTVKGKAIVCNSTIYQEGLVLGNAKITEGACIHSPVFGVTIIGAISLSCPLEGDFTIEGKGIILPNAKIRNSLDVLNVLCEGKESIIYRTSSEYDTFSNIKNYPEYQVLGDNMILRGNEDMGNLGVMLRGLMPVKVIKFTEELPGHRKGEDFENEIGTLIAIPKIGGRVTMFLPKPNGQMGFISKEIVALDINGGMISITTLGGDIILEKVDNHGPEERTSGI